MSFHDDYKIIRNQIRKYDPISIVMKLICISHNLSTKKPKEWKKYLPWEVLLLLKWVLANYESTNTISVNKSVVQADIRVVNKLLNQLQELFQKYDTNALTTNDKSRGKKYIRQRLFQQGWFQTKLSAESFARQIHLFCNKNDLTTKNLDKIDSLFKNKTGISVFSFFEISFMVWTKFHIEDKKEHFITKEHFINYKHSFTDYDNKYFLSSPYLLDYAIKYYIYDFLKLNYCREFAGIFGAPIFENHLTEGLLYSGINFVDEQTLSKKLPKKSKKVDFLIEIGRSAVLIEAKSSEMPALARATQNNESIINALETSVIKGMQQAYEVANNLTNKDKIYAIIVTYKELYPGTIGTIWEEFLEESLSAFFQEKGISPDIIKPENIYVLSIEEFDNLMKCIKDDNCNLIKILEHVSAADKNPGQEKYIFGDHLKNFRPKNSEILPHLNNSLEKIFESMNSRFLRYHYQDGQRAYQNQFEKFQHCSFLRL